MLTFKHHSREVLPKLLLVVTIIAVFIPSLFFPFIWDDFGQIVNNNALRGGITITKLLLSPTFDLGGGMLAGAFFRPLFVLANYLNFQLWGLLPFGYRLLQLALHALNALIVFNLITLIMSRMKARHTTVIATFVALLFAVHPVAVESVVYISSVSEVLYTFFSLCALWLLIRYDADDRFSRWLFFFILVFLGMLAKETAVITLIIGAVYLALFTRMTRRKLLAYGGASIGTVLVYCWLRFAVARLPIFFDYGSTISEATLIQRLLTIPYLIMKYVATFLAPVHLITYQNTVIREYTDIRFWGNALLIILITYVLFRLRRTVHGKIYIFFSLWFLISMLPVLNIIGLDMSLADRWMYLPAIGFWTCVVLGNAEFFSRRSRQERRLLFFLCLGIMVFYVGRTYAREFDWRSDEALFGHDILYNPDSAELNNNYGAALIQRGAYITALPFIQKAIHLQPSISFQQTNLGVLYQHLGFDDFAIKQYLFVINEFHTPQAYANLATLFINAKRFGEAQSVIDAAKKLFPTHNRFDALQALLYIKSERQEDAVPILTNLLKKPFIPEDFAELGAILQKSAP